MVATAITVQTPVSLTTVPYAANEADFTWTAADATNGNSAVLTGREMLLCWNSDDDTAYTITVTSVEIDGRTGDITSYSLGFGEYAVMGPFPTKGWNSNGVLLFTANNTAVKFAVIRIPNSL